MLNKIIYIGGVARSGTSWIGQIINSCPNIKYRFQPMFSYEFRGRIDEDSTEQEYDQFYRDLFVTESDFLMQKDKIEKGVYPSFHKKSENILAFKENRFQSYIEPMLRKTPNLYFIGVIRNPNATLYSWSKNEKEFPKGNNLIDEWRFANCKNKGNEDYFGFYKWKEVANLYLDLKQKFPNRVVLIHYDKYVDNQVEETSMLFKKIGLSYTEQTQNFLEASLKGNDSNYYSVFRGQKVRDQWKDKLPRSITQEIHFDLVDTRLEQFLF